MVRWGWVILLVTIASAVLRMSGSAYRFFFLIWVDHWGETAGWAIRGALVVIGALMIVLGRKKKPQPPAP
jgi:hypothetical protein